MKKQQTKEDREAILKRVNHDLYLEGVHKSKFQHEMDKKWINGEITSEEQTKIVIDYVLSGGDLS
jgi:hypothetical protein